MKIPKPASIIEETMALHMKAHGLQPEREFKFHPDRNWRFDFAFPDRMVAVECEGGTRRKSRHTSGQGFEDDCEKYNAAAERGWAVYRYTTRMVFSGAAIDQVLRVVV